ncbi:hypothetical protein [Streptomyces sp. NPDC093970]|uniref:hypothetical protein n=1 Tax=unclassified Streptomyces TaxID=2593676 RepID=UPI003449B7CA
MRIVRGTRRGGSPDMPMAMTVVVAMAVRLPRSLRVPVAGSLVVPLTAAGTVGVPLARNRTPVVPLPLGRAPVVSLTGALIRRPPVPGR